MSGLKVYVAGASAEAEVVSEYIERLKGYGIDVTLDWTKDVIEQGGGNAGLADPQRRHFAKKDLKAIAEADILWLIIPPFDMVSYGCWVELGYALDTGLRIFASGDYRCSIFTSLTDSCYDFHEEALERIWREDRNARQGRLSCLK